MIPLLNVGRILMLAWIVYALVLVFAPALVHRPSSQVSGLVQCVVAYGLGHVMDRAIGAVRRRRAAAAAAADSAAT